MKRLSKNFKKLSARQFKTYAAVILISTIYFPALATETAEGTKIKPSIATPFEVSLDEELSLETWMATPFEVSLDEELSLETWMATPFEVSLDEELSLETWMATPFEVSLDEELSLESRERIPRCLRRG